MATRALVDHVPPIFKCSTFVEVANNYPGSRSFKQSMRNLQDSARPIGDNHLHVQIRRRDDLPTVVQVDFSRDLDVLIGAILTMLSDD
jgi:hypothetical protein